MNAIDMSFLLLQEVNGLRQGDYPIPSTEQLLTEGGDARIALNQYSGANKYGCRPRPDANMASMGSATATTISENAFSAANQLRKRLVQNVARFEPAEVYADEMNRIRLELSELCGLRNGSNADIVFAASGTDVHLIAAKLALRDGHAPVRMLMVDTAETGGGVTAALSGRHFSNKTALGDTVTQGALIGGEDQGQVIAIPVRLADGTPRSSAEIDADFEQQVTAAIAAGDRILLTMVDVSKTGMIAPSVACTVDLHRRYAGKLDVLVDACQFRIAPATLQAYLEQGFMVGITGSKFMGGPSYSGALLIPVMLSKQLRLGTKLEQLVLYSARADWPVSWRTANHLDELSNFGLLLRWEGAIKELRAFRSLSNVVINDFLSAFATAIKQRINYDPVFELLPVPELRRNPFAEDSSWDTIQTIFPFLLFHPSENGRKVPLSSEEMGFVYRSLQEEKAGEYRVQLAQPVDCGRRQGVVVSALRLCASSRLIVEAIQVNGNQKLVIDRALKALDRVSQIVRLTQIIH